MHIKTINNALSVGAQIYPDEIAQIAEQGFRSVICNRPDGEDLDQPPVEVIEAEARKHGLEFGFLPITPGNLSPEDAKQFGDLLANLPGPVLAYCRSGNRCAMLWSLYQAAE